MADRARVLVTGGTGELGREVVAALRAGGRDVVVLSRQAGDRSLGVEVRVGDLGSGTGLAEAVCDVDVIVHAASDPRGHRQVDVVGTARLLAAATATGRHPHVLSVSIVGIDRIRYGYYDSKLAAEALVEQSGLPWTVLRATQFPNLVMRLADAVARPPVVLVPRGVRVQPVDTRDVAARIVTLLDAGPTGRAPDFGGPEVLTAREAVTAYLHATGRRRPVLEVAFPGRIWRELGGGHNLTDADPRGTRTYAGYLGEHVHRVDGTVEVDLPYARRRS